MAENSAIGWTEHTFSPWRGCQHAVDEHGNEHPGCAHCYAEAMAKRSPKMLGQWGPEGTRVKAADAYWQLPIKWNREALAAGERRRVFCASISDVFEDWQGPVLTHDGYTLWKCRKCGDVLDGAAPKVQNFPPTCTRRGCFTPESVTALTLDDLRRDLFARIDQTPWLDWLLLTKRPENVRRMWAGYGYWRCQSCGQARDADPSDRPNALQGEECHYCDQGIYGPIQPGGLSRPLSNAWLGTSVSDQPTADKWGRELMKLWDLVPVLFLSAEPLLGHVAPLLCQVVDGRVRRTIDWVIVGGESGPNRRPCDPAWIESIVRQCREAGVPCYVKQDAGPRPGMQGRLSDEIWAVKEFPVVGALV